MRIASLKVSGVIIFGGAVNVDLQLPFCFIVPFYARACFYERDCKKYVNRHNTHVGPMTCTHDTHTVTLLVLKTREHT